MIIRVSTRGRITIPASIRRKLGIAEGTRLWVKGDLPNGHIMMKPITRDFIHSLRGKYKGRGLLQALIDSRKQERQH